MTGVALVTGSGCGIGLAAAQALTDQGFAVALNEPLDSLELTEAFEMLKTNGAKVMKAPFDVRDATQYDAVLSNIEATLGALTTLVNNAGVGVVSRGDPLDVTPKSWDRCLEVNAKAMFFLTQRFVKILLKRDRRDDTFCSIVNVTSSNAVAVAEQRAEYAASKAAAAMISKTWAVRLGREGIAVYDVQPGLIVTSMTAPVIDQYAERAAAGLTLFPRVGQPEDIGSIIASLASGKLPYTTGQTISADGGLLVPRY